MSEILVTGGSGALGKLVVAKLAARDHTVRVLSRRRETGTHVGDLSTGTGVEEAARGVPVVVHAASDTQRLGRADLKQTRNLLAACGHAHHLLYISIVGIDRIPFAYYRRKLACEQLIAHSGVPYTILRATQFHELLGFALRSAERLPLAPLPTDFRFQTVAAEDAAERVATIIGESPTGGIVNFGGPQVHTLGELAATWRSVRGRPRRIVRLPLSGAVAAAFREGRNTCPEQAHGTQTWSEFVGASPEIPYRISGRR